MRGKFEEKEIRGKEDLDRFVEENAHQTEELQDSLQHAMLRSRSQQMKSKPTENVLKSISLMMDVDSRMFSRMGLEEKETLKAELEKLAALVESFRKIL